MGTHGIDVVSSREPTMKMSRVESFGDCTRHRSEECDTLEVRGRERKNGYGSCWDNLRLISTAKWRNLAVVRVQLLLGG